MIIRVFRGIVHEGRQQEFEQFFLDTALPLLRSQPGLLEVSIGKPLPSSPNEFLMITTWTDLESLQGFAGQDWNKAVIDPREAHLLRETFVHHYEGADV